MRKLIFMSLFVIVSDMTFAQSIDLHGVTYGFGAGYSYTFDKIYDYSLTPDKDHNLKLQPLAKHAFVISSVIMVKLGKIATDPEDKTLVKQSNKGEYDAQKVVAKKQSSLLYDQLVQTKLERESLTSLSLTQDSAARERTKQQINNLDNADKLTSAKLKAVNEKLKKTAGASFADRLSINAALNLAEVNNNIQFNKNIDGGLGLGYFLNDYVQLALFCDVSRIPQLRDNIVNTYQDKSIPNADGSVYNALDTKDNNLFYNKTITGLSFKVIFSLANKKPASTSPTR